MDLLIVCRMQAVRELTVVLEKEKNGVPGILGITDIVDALAGDVVQMGVDDHRKQRARQLLYELCKKIVEAAEESARFELLFCLDVATGVGTCQMSYICFIVQGDHARLQRQANCC